MLHQFQSSYIPSILLPNIHKKIYHFLPVSNNKMFIITYSQNLVCLYIPKKHKKKTPPWIGGLTGRGIGLANGLLLASKLSYVAFQLQGQKFLAKDIGHNNYIIIYKILVFHSWQSLTKFLVQDNVNSLIVWASLHLFKFFDHVQYILTILQ